AGVQRLAAVSHHEEAVPGDHQVGRHAGRLRGTRAEVRADAGQLHAESDLCGVGAAGGLARHRGVLDELRQGVLELHGGGLEAHRVHVGDVVAGHVEHGLVRAQSGDAGEEGAEHEMPFGEEDQEERVSPERASSGTDCPPMVTCGTGPAKETAVTVPVWALPSASVYWASRPIRTAAV